MIDYGVGVTEVQTYSIKKLDSDYFDEARVTQTRASGSLGGKRAKAVTSWARRWLEGTAQTARWSRS